MSRRRERVGKRREASGPDPLFGTGIRPPAAYEHFGGESLTVGFWSMVRQLPRLTAVVARLAWRADRRALAAVSVAEILVGVSTATALLSTNQVLQGLLSDRPTADRVVAALPALTAVMAAAVCTNLLRALSTAATGRVAPKVERLANVELLDRASRVEFAVVEDPEFHNLLSSARRGAQSTRQVVDDALAVLAAGIGLLSASGVLATLHPVLLPLLVLAVLPRGWGAVRVARAQYVSIKRWMELTRQLDLLAHLLTDRDAAEEIRTHDCGPYLLEHYRRLARRSEEEQARLASGAAGTGLLAAALAGLATAATFTALGGLLLAGKIELAAAGTAVLAVRTGSASLTDLVTRVGRLYEQGLYVLDWQRAGEHAERLAIPVGGQPATAPPTRITTHGVGFRYPRAAAPALDGVDVEIRRGEVVAFVGENGSGKTTLARLLTGLYLPATGTVCWDGVPTDRLDRHSVFAQVALLSQEYVQWPFTAAANVGIGRARPARPPTRLDAAARAVGAEFVADLPDGWDTLLAREFWGGTWLSGGQWQRIALARAWYRDAPVLLLDEPTAALDPRAEIEVFDQVVDLAGAGRAVILITHRLGSVRRADRIYVLAHGRVVEQGSHAELIRLGGRYAEMYRAQAAQYHDLAPAG